MKKFGILLMAAVLILVLVACNVRYEHIHSYHIYLEDSWIEKPTCTENGSAKLYCNCRDFQIVVVPATGHYWEKDDSASFDATCTEDGQISYNCICGESYILKLAAGHQYKAVVTQEPTCLQEGYYIWNCVCGLVEDEVYTIPKLDHVWENVTYQNATCTEEGKATYTCYHCKESYTETKPASGHDWSEWYQILAPSIAMDGYEKRYCYRCDIEETRALEKIAGDFSRYPDFIMPNDWRSVGFFDSPDDIAVESVFSWAIYKFVEPVSSHWGGEYGETRTRVFKQEDLDAFTVGCLGRTYDYSQLKGKYGTEYIYDAEAKTITEIISGGAGDMVYPPAYEGYAQLDETHYAIYYSLAWEEERFDPGVIVVEVRDGNYIIVSHQSA